jgi:hypothetical protein
MSLPDFIIIGAMKSATSTVHDQLAAQPGIFMSTPKEPNFFSNDEIWALGMAWYESLFDGAKPGDLKGESSTHYTKLPTYPHTVERMKVHVPHAKLIYMTRDPIDRLVSHYMHGWSEHTIAGDINDAIHKYPELIAYGRYDMQLAPVIEAYGRDNILVIDFADVVTRPQETLERICTFIGYAGKPVWVEEEGRKNVSSERLRDNKLRDLIVFNPVVSFIRTAFIPRSVRDWVKGFWQMKEKPKLTEESKAWLREQFAKP